MDQTNHQKLSRFTKLLLSISVFSLFLSSSNFLSFLPPWHFHLFPFPLRLVTHAVSKNCIFLLCNGILVFLTRDSGFIGTKTKSWHSTSNKDPPRETLYMMESKLLAMDIEEGVFPDVAQEDFALGKEGKTLNKNNNNHEDCVVEMEIGNVCFHAEGCARDDDDNNKEEEQEDNISFSTLETRNIVAISDPNGDEELDECGGEREDATSEDFPDVAQEDFALGKEGKTLNKNNNNHEDCVVEMEIGNVCFHAEGCARDDDDNNKEEEQEDNISFSTLETRNIVAVSDPNGDEELDECGGEREDATSEDYKNGGEIRYGDNVMTAEELDKKFDDFIRRMKEGIMIETQQQRQQLLWSSV